MGLLSKPETVLLCKPKDFRWVRLDNAAFLSFKRNGREWVIRDDKYSADDKRIIIWASSQRSLMGASIQDSLHDIRLNLKGVRVLDEAFEKYDSRPFIVYIVPWAAHLYYPEGLAVPVMRYDDFLLDMGYLL